MSLSVFNQLCELNRFVQNIVATAEQYGTLNPKIWTTAHDVVFSSVYKQSNRLLHILGQDPAPEPNGEYEHAVRSFAHDLSGRVENLRCGTEQLTIGA